MQRPLALLPALDRWDGAERAGMVAAVGDLHIGRWSGMLMRERGSQPIASRELRFWLLAKQRSHRVTDAEPLARGQHLVDPSREIERIIAQRRKATCRNDELSRIALIDQILQGLDRLGPRGAQEIRRC